ncbi:MAG: hypothetical protein H8E44_26190 [Planctomycetes bacterium]|nr:hypothetical protein [Planctomycetota bacterium]MBL7044248.1 hypothetical protein [Pirellulaceae bacterium]
MVTGFAPADLSISQADKDILRMLAERVAEIAASPRMQETRELWKRLNTLEKTRPLVFCDPENGWNEIITESQMTCTGKLARRWEMDLRKEIFWGDEMGDDKPVEPYFDVPYTVAPDDWGLEAEYHRTDDLGSCVWDSPVKDYATDLAKLHSPKVNIDWETTEGCVEIAKEVLGGILTVRLKGIWWWSLGLTWPAVTLRGLSNVMYDFVDHPDELKELLAIISKGHLEKLDYLEVNSLLALNNDGAYIGSGGYGFTDELPQDDFDGRVRCVDMWGFTESQETVSVSPDMYEEFIFPYEKPIMDRFGLTCYGCCEPVHGRWHIVEGHHNLRRVSCSPWADVQKMAGYLEDKYILSIKPAPAAISTPTIDEDSIRQGLRKVLDLTKDCIVELIMKDNHTLGDRPENAVRWCQIAKEEVERRS